MEATQIDPVQDSLNIEENVEQLLEEEPEHSPEELHDFLYVGTPEFEDNITGISKFADELAYSMAVCVVKGFRAHDQRRLEEAELWFLAKDLNMYEHLPVDLVIQASEAYVEALDYKDRLEWFHLPGKIQREYSESWKDLSHEELFDLDRETASSLGVGEVDTSDLSRDGIKSLESDIKGWFNVLQPFHLRDVALGIPIEGAYSIPETEFWRNHKTDNLYLNECYLARMGEMSASTGLDEFVMHATGTELFKNSDGRYGPSFLPTVYARGVEMRDMKNIEILSKIPYLVAPYYRGSLATRFEDEFDGGLDVNTVTAFGLSSQEDPYFAEAGV